ncbi:MAG: dihydroneopterin aldolase [Rhodospirillaceae bacterium]|jgi:dihydroneopterin aldolase|nr:dihydroneopterin aldolase [Rhodospirillaceae bacterium]|tara:strand:- start:2769 stop:3188 length:420 start_codon:yes stop_codon:yes gene_type:complete
MTASHIKLVKPNRIADAKRALRHVFIRDLMLPCSIGVHRHEKTTEQRVRINLDLAVLEGGQPINDDIRNVICYEHLTKGIEEIVGRGHVNLVETLAENIAAMCLEDGRVKSARVRVEKLDILDDAESVGVEIERFNFEV